MVRAGMREARGADRGDTPPRSLQAAADDFFVEWQLVPLAEASGTPPVPEAGSKLHPGGRKRSPVRGFGIDNHDVSA